MSEPQPLPAAFVYRWIAGLFLAPPGAGDLAAYRGAEGQALLAALAQPAAELAELTAPGGDLEAAAGRLAAAHSSAFAVGGPKAPAPYASVWLSERGLLYQEPAREMTRLLAAAGLGLPEELSEPPDHLGFQLNLLAELDEASRAGAPVPLAPGLFLRDHVMSWVPRFAAACARLRNPVFYPGLAAALTSYLHEKAKEMEIE